MNFHLKRRRRRRRRRKRHAASNIRRTKGEHSPKHGWNRRPKRVTWSEAGFGCGESATKQTNKQTNKAWFLCNWNESTKGTLEVHTTYPTYACSLIPNHAAAAKRKEVLIIRAEQEFLQIRKACRSSSLSSSSSSSASSAQLALSPKKRGRELGWRWEVGDGGKGHTRFIVDRCFSQKHTLSNMYFPFRHDVNAKESMLNSSASMVLDSGSSVRPFASSSFSAQSGTQPFVHHGGNLQGLHNIQGNYSMQSVQNALPSRNQGMAGGLSTGTHQPTGGRFSSNNLPVGLPQQLSHVGLHGHTPMTSRSGISVVGNHAFSSSSNGGGGSGPGGSLGAATVGNRGSFSALGASGPRIGSSGGSIGGGGGGLVGGGGLTRALNAGVGLDVQNLNGSRVNIGPLTGDSGIGGQGPGRSGTSMLQQGVNMSSSTYNPSSDLLAMISRGSPKGISLLGNNFSTAPGSGVQGQVLSGNGQLGSLGLTNDGGANDGLAFDISEFPQLGARQSSSGGLQGPLASLRKQGVSVNAIVQQNQEFTIQNEDFPALPGFRGGSSELTSESEHHKDQQHENALAANMPQHFMMGRSAGMLPGGSYVPHRQLQQQLAGTVSGSMASMNASDLQHLHANIADSFPSSHGLSASYHSQAVGPPGAGGAQVHRSGTGSPGLGSYDQLVHHYHQSQVRQGGASHQQQQLAQQQMVRDLVKVQQRQVAPEQFGLLGLLSVIRMSDPDLTTLALGTDLTTLGLNLNSRENLYKTFASPWAEAPTRGEPEFTLPQCYVHEAPRLQPGYFSKFQQDTLFYIFYSMPNDEAQLYAADELCKRGWFFHREHKLWLIHDPNMEPFVKADAFERGSYYFFDHNIWETGRKENFVLQYDMIEKRPQLPSQH